MHRSALAFAIAVTLMAATPVFASGAATIAASPSADASAATTPSVAAAAAAKAARLDKLYADFWEASLKLNPLQATFIGDPRYNDQMPNFLSKDYIDQTNRFNEQWLAKAKAIGSAGLSGQALLSYQIFIEQQQDAVDGERFHNELLPIDQFNNMALMAVQLGSGTNAQPFQTVKDYDDWLARASKIPAIFDTAIANMREGVKEGIVQPKVLMVKVIPQLDAVIKGKPEATEFWDPIKNMPKDFSAADKARLTAAYRHLIADQLMPSFHRLRDYIANDYMQHTRSSVGMSALPDGKAWYAYDVRTQTTTDETPEQIHAIGLSEVARIKKEMDALRVQVGYKGDLKSFFHYLQTDPRFTFKSEKALLDGYNSVYAKVMKGVPRDFSILPKAKFEIRPVEAYRAKSAAGGQYQPPSMDGSRPGIFYVNTYDLPSRKTWDMEDLFLHEAIPGHHFQISIQQEQTGLPMFRRFGGFNAYVEGYALYCETIGYELGMYTDPYQKFGQLQAEQFRAMRLVVDTGIHALGWSREKAIAYMLDNSAMSPVDIEAEVERYIAMPAQALAYKTGQMKISELRAKAAKALGPKFDVRAFHTQLLEDGSLPLAVLEKKMDNWIASQQH
ncbi:MAG: DUF885 domain-containing protein [Proteobacteria bacterium]|nr:DUF885 domain-containing protein [Pseudomonadota bacterium]